MKLEEAICDFLLHCRIERNLMPKTLKAYSTDLNQASSFFNKNSEITNISKHEIRNYLFSLQDLKPKSIKRKIATFKALFNYLEFEDKILINPFRKMKINIREPKVIRTVMDIKEIIKTFKNGYSKINKISGHNTYAHFESLRNVVILELLFTTGARVSEIANLKRVHINLKEGGVVIKGKGDKERLIHIFNKETINILKRYNTALEIYNRNSEWFLLNRFRNKISDQSIRNLVKTVCSSAGISKHITPHTFRHTFATLLLENNMDIKYIQLLLGHSSIVTTQIYTHVNPKKQRQLLISKHPRKEFSMQDN